MTQPTSTTSQPPGATRFKRWSIPDAEVDRILGECVAAINAPSPCPYTLADIKAFCSGKWPTKKPRQSRKPTLASVIKQARKAGIDPARVEIKSDGSYVVDTSKLEHQQGNEVDEWMAKHAHAPERH
jgi:hypothetical protein